MLTIVYSFDNAGDLSNLCFEKIKERLNGLLIDEKLFHNN